MDHFRSDQPEIPTVFNKFQQLKLYFQKLEFNLKQSAKYFFILLQKRKHKKHVGIYKFRLVILGIYLLTLYLLSTTFVIFDIT